jgi:hypothetical protein
MDSDVLDRILAGPDEPATTASAADAASTDTQADTSTTAKPAREESTDPELQWDDDGGDAGGDEPPDAHETAPDQRTDADLDAIEERNRWMKGRLAPVKTKLTEAEAEVARLRAENEQLRGGRPPAEQQPEAQPHTIEEYVASHPEVQRLSKALQDLEGESDKLTMGEYQDRKLDILTDLKIAKRDVAQALTETVRSRQQALASAEAKVTSDFHAAVLAKKDELPDVDKALGRIERNAGNLHLEIRRSLIMDEHGNINPDAAELVHEIGTSKQALSYLIAQSRAAAQGRRVPTAALEYIGRIKDRIRSQREQPAPDQVSEQDTGVRVREHVRRPSVPREVRSTSANASGPTDLQAWALNAIKKGERPW